MEAPPDPIIQECSTCGTLIDTSDEEPLALTHCPNCGAAMRVRRMFDQFELVEVLGAGGMGAVYRAQDTKLNRHVALKVLRSEHMDDRQLIDSLTKEAETTASINHPHVVKVFTTGTAHGVFYIAMELVDKGSLDDLMTLQEKVAEMQVLEVGIQVGQGLDAAFRRGLIHRDVKPGNILFADAHTAKITDFGLAVLQEHANEGSGDIWGTPYYVAPEKLETPPREDFRSDIYSLGATLFHALAGRPPFEAETASMVALKHLKSQVVSLQSFAPEVSSATTYVINKSLSKDPEARYQSYEEFIKSLQYARDQLAEAARTPQAKRRVIVTEQTDEAMSWVTFAMVAFIVLGGVLAFTFRGKLFGKAETGNAPRVLLSKPSAVSIAAEFAAARELLVAGKTSEAAAALRALDVRGGAPQPLQNWITLTGGLAWFLLGQPEEARVELARIEKRGLYSPDALESKMATFFVDAARLAARPEPQPATVSTQFDKTTHEAFALLLLAVKDWMLGDFDSAGPLFRQFQASTPGGEYGWIEDFKPIAQGFSANFVAYRDAADALEAADTPEKQTQALAAVRAARGRLTQGGKLTEYFEQQEARLDKLLQAHEEKLAEQKAAGEAADAKIVAELKARIAGICAAWKFVEARRHVADAKLTSDKAMADRDVLLQWTEGLSRFKATLVADLNAKGYAKDVAKKAGTMIPGGRIVASDAKIDIVGTYGSVPVAWTDIAPNSIAAMAAAFIGADATPAKADRQWLLGLYLIHAGMRPQGLALLQRAAETRPDYQAWVPRIQEMFGAP